MEWSEQYRLTAKDWVEKDAAARLAEESESAVLAQRISAQGDIPHNRAERIVRGSPEWAEYIKAMVDAKTAANLARVKKEYVRMKYMEEQSKNADARRERGM